MTSSTPWRTFVAIDLETTGLDPRRDRIIEIGAVRFNMQGIVERFTALVNPHRSIPLSIQQLTGIRDADVASAPDLEQVLPEFLSFVDLSVDALVGHNVDFDLGFLHAAGVHLRLPALDTYDLATILVPGMPSYSLGELARQLDIPLDQAHRALGDAEAAARLFIDLLARIRGLPGWILEILASRGDETQWPALRLFADARAAASQGEASLAVESFPAPGGDGPAAGWPGEDGVPGVAVDPERIEAFFASEGPLRSLLGPDYEVRQGQVRMARLVADAFNRGEHRLIEAGTGTGKSLAYLVPAALWATANRSRVVVATHTVPLQDQLTGQEIPRLQRLWRVVAPEGEELRAAQLKGRRRYLCTRRLYAWYHGRRLSEEELRFLAKVLVWLPHTHTGDVSELALRTPLERRCWEQVASHPTCSPERCHAPLPGAPFVGVDFFWRARWQAEQAHLLVVNHALLLADLEAEGRVLPPYDHLIIDEAHHLEDAATEQLTRRVSQAVLEDHLARLRLHPDLRAWLAEAPSQEATAQSRRLSLQVQAFRRGPLAIFYESLRAFARAWLRAGEGHNGYVQRLTLDARLRTQPRWSQIELEWDHIRQELRAIAQGGRAFLQELVRLPGHDQEPQATHLDELQSTLHSLEVLEEAMEIIVFQPLTAQETVTWLEYHRDQVTLCAAPAQVGDLLAQRLFAPRRTVVLTGATLSTGAGVDFMADRLGCWHMDAVSIPSPFDYRERVLVVLPTNMPMPGESGYQAAVEQAIVAAAQAAQGRTLVLFTSHSHLRTTAAAIRAPLNRLGIKVLEHGSSGRHQLLRAFRTLEPTVLLGTGTFWEGIDVPGDALSCLVMVRLPFAVPTDPLFAARANFYEDPFHEYSVPDAVLRFRQGFGRLMRRADDRGIVVLLDSRLWKKRYGHAFLDALPGCSLRRTHLTNLGDVVADWLAARPVSALFAGENLSIPPALEG